SRPGARGRCRPSYAPIAPERRGVSAVLRDARDARDRPRVYAARRPAVRGGRRQFRHLAHVGGPKARRGTGETGRGTIVRSGPRSPSRTLVEVREIPDIPVIGRRLAT